MRQPWTGALVNHIQHLQSEMIFAAPAFLSRHVELQEICDYTCERFLRVSARPFGRRVDSHGTARLAS